MAPGDMLLSLERRMEQIEAIQGTTQERVDGDGTGHGRRCTATLTTGQRQPLFYGEGNASAARSAVTRALDHGPRGNARRMLTRIAGKVSMSGVTDLNT
jgi:hypothetical protein